MCLFQLPVIHLIDGQRNFLSAHWCLSKEMHSRETFSVSNSYTAYVLFKRAFITIKVQSYGEGNLRFGQKT